ncbi:MULTISPECIES: hypothetical protein [Amycolatopsis]|uniref:Zinc-finger domain-containing protein n=1 Tax=Amycolatopsis bullii TaxID=941987 RepID=A0ABQ3KMB8_9PSEU|nr:hypothetical protein [Amycolatopsis bullii]GHG35289.1 hypothetical protein GCM10017567_64780 [Amycolatopsis bullii]
MSGRKGEAAAYGLGVHDDPEEFEAHLRGCARCRGRVAGFTPVAGALAEAVRLGYLPPGDGAARRRKSAGAAALRGPAAGPLLLLALGVAATTLAGVRVAEPPARGEAADAMAFCGHRPAVGKIRFATAASIVSPGQVVAGTGSGPRSLPWSAGFQ